MTSISDSDSKSILPEHSVAKVTLLGEYLKHFLSIIANDRYTKLIRIFDLFCGEGIYDDSGEGSPIVIMKAVKDIYDTRTAKSLQSPKINCYFNDNDKEKIDKVTEAIKTKRLHDSQVGEIHFSNKDYDDFIKELASRLPQKKEEKNFVFIDPYGYKHIKLSDIKALLSRGNVEVLLFLPTQFMYRFDANGTPEALIDFIEEIVDYEQWKATDSVWEFIGQLNTAFRKNLGEKVFVDTFTIQKEPQTVFCLFFFSCHIKGFEKMLVAKWKLDSEQGKGWDYKGNQQSSLFPELKIHPLEQKLRTFLSESVRGNGEVYEFTLQCGFLPKHTSEVFRNLQKAGNLTVEEATGSKARTGSFYVNYKAFRDEPNKVRFIMS